MSEIRIPAGLPGALRSARHVAVLTGAGISAESGVPTFREAPKAGEGDSEQALWARVDPMELATPEAFRRDPARVWAWYAWRRGIVTRAEPNAGHIALAEMETRLREAGSRLTLITQNVDGLHKRAGSHTVIELHGSILRYKCSVEGALIEAWPPTEEVPPRCPNCGAPLRPDVVWFGEALPAAALSAAQQAARGCDLFLCAGTSAVVEPAASLPLLAVERGALTVEVNPTETPLTPRLRHSLRGPAGVVLPALLAAAWPAGRD